MDKPARKEILGDVPIGTLLSESLQPKDEIVGLLGIDMRFNLVKMEKNGELW